MHVHGQGGVIDCEPIYCTPIECQNDEQLVTSLNECCPRCEPVMRSGCLYGGYMYKVSTFPYSVVFTLLLSDINPLPDDKF